MPVQLYDTTLRDGAQMEGISLSVEDKLRIARKLDELGVHFIEGGWPGANPKDIEFFQRAPDLHLRAKLVAFGSTRRAGGDAVSDPTLNALVAAGTEAVTIVGKASDLHVRRVLETSPEENLAMIADSVRFLKSEGPPRLLRRRALLRRLRWRREVRPGLLARGRTRAAPTAWCCATPTAARCRTTLVHALEVVRKVLPGASLGIHCHNDADVAVANSLLAVEHGVEQVQACINGYGERCGNANMCSIIAGLKLKLDREVISDDQLAKLTEVSHFVGEVANMTPWLPQPYVGASAFAHKAGYHTDGVIKVAGAYQHIDPASVGNERRLLVSELGGSRGLLDKVGELGIDYPMTRDDARRVGELIKEKEADGYQYEGADASLELLVRRNLPGYRTPFNLDDFWVIERRRHVAEGEGRQEMQAEAMVKVRVFGRAGSDADQLVQTAADGNGPVNALDAAVRKALGEFYPGITDVRLVDYKVRIIDSGSGTGASVRVLIECSDSDYAWQTVGASTDIIEASWLALSDALEWWVLRHPG